MINTKVAKRYASAIFQIAKEKNNLDVILNDFRLIMVTIEQSRDFENLLMSPVVNYSKKVQIFNEIFANKIDAITFEFIKLLINKKRDYFISQIIEQFIVLYNKHNNLTPVEILSAIELDDDTKSKVNNKISSALNLKIIPNFRVNKNLKGGIKIQVDDWVYDASISTKLENIRESLISNSN
jgi:F-type H+-transporting ATPase subunit delta